MENIKTDYFGTIEIQTNHFDIELVKEQKELIAQEILIHFNNLLIENELDKVLRFSSSWKNGCIVEQINLYAQLINGAATVLTATGTYIVIKDYEKTRGGIIKIVNDLSKVSFVIGDLAVRLVKITFTEQTKIPFRNRIEPNFENKKIIDNENKIEILKKERTKKTSQLSIKLTPEFKKNLKHLSVEHNMHMSEIIEEAVNLWKKTKKED